MKPFDIPITRNQVTAATPGAVEAHVGRMNRSGRTAKALVPKWTVIGLLLSGTALAAYFGTARGSIPFLPQTTTTRPVAAPVPVFAAAVERKDVPVYLTGIGTVQAF